jgi:5-methyltetrahydropteroyltriglutamate--homocysteine methyltransferase
MEEPQIHMLAGRARVVDDAINAEFMVDVFNNTVKGLRDKTEVWCHTCWGNPSAQRMFDQIPSYLPGLELLDQIDADVITFETRASGPGELEAIGRAIAEKKIGIGMIDHHTLQVESPAEVADLARLALEHIPAERLVLTSDCGMGREGMPRRHAFYKMVSLVLGANIVREELGLPTVEVLAAEPEYSLIRTS